MEHRSYKQPSLSAMAVKEVWNEVLGQPKRDPYIDIRGALPIVSETLADAYRGKNEYLGMRIDKGVGDVNSWVLKVVAPLHKLNGSLGVTLTNMQFLPHILDENPPGSVPKRLTYKSDTIVAEVERRGAGIVAELQWAGSEEGIYIFAQKIDQISASIVETARVHVLAALMHADDYYNAFAAMYGEPGSPAEAERILSNELEWWCFIQQRENGLAKYKEYVKAETRRAQNAPVLDTFIVDSGVEGYLRTVPMSSTEHWLGGDLAVSSLNSVPLATGGRLGSTKYLEDSMVPALRPTRDTQVFFSRPVYTDDKGYFDILQRHAQIGEYVIMDYAPSQVNENFKSDDRTIKFYDETADTNATLTQHDVIENCNLFDRDGNLVPCKYGGSKFATQFKKSATPVPVPWFLSDLNTPHHSWGEALLPDDLAKRSHASFNAMIITAISSMEKVIPNGTKQFTKVMQYVHDLGARPIWTGRSGDNMANQVDGLATTREQGKELETDADVRAVQREELGLIGRVIALDDNAPEAVTLEGGKYFNRPTAVGMAAPDGYYRIGKMWSSRSWTAEQRTRFGASSYQGGCATYAYIKWAAVNHPNETERKQASNADLFLGLLASWIKKLHPESTFIDPDAAIPYLCEVGANSTDKTKQALLEALQGGARGIVRVKYQGVADPADPAATAADIAKWLPGMPVRLVAVFVNAAGGFLRTGRATALSKIITAMNIISGDDEASFLAAFLNRQNVIDFIYDILAENRPGEVRRLAGELYELFKAYYDLTARSGPPDSALRTIKESLQKLAGVRNTPVVSATGPGRDQIESITYLPMTWPASVEEPIRFAGADNSLTVFYPTLPDNPMSFDASTAPALGDPAAGPAPIAGRIGSKSSKGGRSSASARGGSTRAQFDGHVPLHSGPVRIGISIRQHMSRLPRGTDDDLRPLPVATSYFTTSSGDQSGRTMLSFFEDLLHILPMTKPVFFALHTLNIFIPWQPIAARPFATYSTGTALHVRAGATDMAQGKIPYIRYMYGDTAVTMGLDAATQMITGAVNTFGAPVITSGLAVFKGYNAWCEDYLGGLGGDFIDPIERGIDYAYYDPSTDGSIILIPAGPDLFKYPFKLNRFDLMGDYVAIKRRGYTPLPASNRPDGYHYGECAWVFEMYDLQKISVQRGPVSSQINTPNAATNTHCYQGLQVRRSATGMFDDVTPGAGHWDDKQGRRNAKMRKGHYSRAAHYTIGVGSGGSGSTHFDGQ